MSNEWHVVKVRKVWNSLAVVEEYQEVPIWADLFKVERDSLVFYDRGDPEPIRSFGAGRWEDVYLYG